jgi:hypothetical protein
MHHLGGDAVVLGAFRAIADVTDDGAVAMLQTGPTIPALVAHGPFIALADDKPWLPRGARGDLSPPSGLRASAHPRPLVFAQALIRALWSSRKRSSPAQFV